MSFVDDILTCKFKGCEELLQSINQIHIHLYCHYVALFHNDISEQNLQRRWVIHIVMTNKQQ